MVMPHRTKSSGVSKTIEAPLNEKLWSVDKLPCAPCCVKKVEQNFQFRILASSFGKMWCSFHRFQYSSTST